jgi:hypothetical protein
MLLLSCTTQVQATSWLWMGWLVVKISREWTEIIVYNKLLGHWRIWYKDFPKVCNEFSYYPQQISCTYGTHITYEMAEVIGIALQGSSENVETMHLETWLGLALQHCSKNMKIVDSYALYINLDRQWFVTKAFWEMSHFLVIDAMFCTRACPLHKRRAVITKYLVICEELHHMYPSKYMNFILPN